MSHANSYLFLAVCLDIYLSTFSLFFILFIFEFVKNSLLTDTVIHCFKLDLFLIHCICRSDVKAKKTIKNKIVAHCAGVPSITSGSKKQIHQKESILKELITKLSLRQKYEEKKEK